MIELSIGSFNGCLVDDSVLEDMHRLVKKQMQDQGIKIKTSRHPGGRGGAGGGLLFRFLLVFLQAARHLSLRRNSKSFRRNQPSFEIYLRDSESVAAGSAVGWSPLGMERPREMLHIGHMISEILKVKYPFYNFHLMARFYIPAFNYSLEMTVQGALSENRIGMALRFVPTELKSHIHESIYAGDGLLVKRNLVYFDKGNKVLSSKVYRYFTFDRMHTLSRNKSNIRYVKENSCWVVYPRYDNTTERE